MSMYRAHCRRKLPTEAQSKGITESAIRCKNGPITGCNGPVLLVCNVAALAGIICHSKQHLHISNSGETFKRMVSRKTDDKMT